jgi:hypothetical protein
MHTKGAKKYVLAHFLLRRVIIFVLLHFVIEVLCITIYLSS